MNEHELVDWLKTKLEKSGVVPLLGIRHVILAVEYRGIKLLVSIKNKEVIINILENDQKFDCQVIIDSKADLSSKVEYQLNFSVGDKLPLSTSSVIEQIFNHQKLNSLEWRENLCYPFILQDAENKVLYKNNNISLIKYVSAFKNLDVYITSGFSDEDATNYAPYDAKSMGLSGSGKEFFFLSKCDDDELTKVFTIFFKKLIDETYIFMRGRTVEWDYFETGFGGFIVLKNEEFGNSVYFDGRPVYFDMFMPLSLDEAKELNHLKERFDEHETEIRKIAGEIFENSIFGFREDKKQYLS